MQQKELTVWRIHLKPSAEEGVNPRAICLKQGYMGLGWSLGDNASPVTWDEYVTSALAYRGDKSGWYSPVNTLVNKVKEEDLCWTRDDAGQYWLGRISGAWEYRSDPLFIKADLRNVRSCEWIKVGVNDEVPGKIQNCFIPSRIIQPIKDWTCNIYSRVIYNQVIKCEHYSVEDASKSDVFQLFSSYDLEDLVGLYLQVTEGWAVVPSTCKIDTPHYEYVLRRGCERAVVSVKAGHSALRPSDFGELAQENRVYLFALSQNYPGPSVSNVVCLERQQLNHFILKHRNILPRPIRAWLGFCDNL